MTRKHFSLCLASPAWPLDGKALPDGVLDTGPLRIHSRHPNARLRDLSATGRTALVVLVRDPVLLVRLGIRPPRRDPDEIYLLDIAAAKLMGRIKVRGQVTSAVFFPGLESSGILTVFDETEFATGTWSAGHPIAVTSRGESAVDFATLHLTGPHSGVSGTYAPLGAGDAKTFVLNRLSFPGFRVTERVPMLPPGVNSNPGKGSVSIEAGLLAFPTAFPDPRIVVRRLSDFSLAYQVRAPQGFGFGEILFSKKGDLLIAMAVEAKSAGAEGRFAVVYRAENGEELRRITLTGVTRLAVSPDGRLLAAGERRSAGPSKAQALVSLYDFATGERLARAAHRAVDVPRNNPWAGQFNAIAFTADGKFLLTSATDIYVWTITGSKH